MLKLRPLPAGQQGIVERVRRLDYRKGILDHGRLLSLRGRNGRIAEPDVEAPGTGRGEAVVVGHPGRVEEQGPGAPQPFSALDLFEEPAGHHQTETMVVVTVESGRRSGPMQAFGEPDSLPIENFADLLDFPI